MPLVQLPHQDDFQTRKGNETLHLKTTTKQKAHAYPHLEPQQTNGVSMGRICHNHIPQTNPQHQEEETQTTDSQTLRTQ